MGIAPSGQRRRVDAVPNMCGSPDVTHRVSNLVEHLGIAVFGFASEAGGEIYGRGNRTGVVSGTTGVVEMITAADAGRTVVLPPLNGEGATVTAPAQSLGTAKQPDCCLDKYLRVGSVALVAALRGLPANVKIVQPLLSTVAEVKASRLRSVPVPGMPLPHRVPDVQMSP